MRFSSLAAHITSYMFLPVKNESFRLLVIFCLLGPKLGQTGKGLILFTVSDSAFHWHFSAVLSSDFEPIYLPRILLRIVLTVLKYSRVASST